MEGGREGGGMGGVGRGGAEGGGGLGAVEVSAVRFRPLSDAERYAYLDSGRWEGKSGAYGVQDRDPFVSVVRGSFSNVVGLPMERLGGLLRDYRALQCQDLPASAHRQCADSSIG